MTCPQVSRSSHEGFFFAEIIGRQISRLIARCYIAPCEEYSEKISRKTRQKIKILDC